ncbi:Heterokaryon incompatibility protein 6, OR allele [Colletotrichum fructicola]|nr:Heterokaryon incompatibility protein 6, OR allele [Colletotrichum fructicola]
MPLSLLSAQNRPVRSLRSTESCYPKAHDSGWLYVSVRTNWDSTSSHRRSCPSTTMAWSQVVVGDRDAIIEGSSGVSPFDNIYSALPIATEELRILNVHPASSITSPVVADLFIENFRTQRKSYEALSCTWGDSTSPETITVNGVEINVTRNLRLALQTLRHQSRKPGGFKLWIDSICINQDNVPERNAQVAQMGKIYSQASHVAIWLGDASETSEAAMRLLFYQENRVHENNEVKDHMEFEIPSSELFDTAAEEYHRLFTTDPEDLHWRREEYVLRSEEVT